MWSNASLRSKLKTFLGSKSLRGRVEAVAPDSYPPFFQNASVKGSLYQLPDFVVDSESLVETLRRNNTALFLPARFRRKLRNQRSTSGQSCRYCPSRPQHLSERQALYFHRRRGQRIAHQGRRACERRNADTPPQYGVLKTKRPAPTLCALHRRQFQSHTETDRHVTSGCQWQYCLVSGR